MSTFIRNIILFFLFFVAVSMLLVLAYVKKYDVDLREPPAPNLSNSYSLNEKIRFIRRAKKKASILAIGSSMTLNNLHSQVLTKNFHTTKYLNAASWGMTMKDNFTLMKILYRQHAFDTLICVSSVVDFQRFDKKINEEKIEQYLNSRPLPLSFYAKLFNLGYFYDNYKYAKKIRKKNSQNHYLVFDPYGAVNLSLKIIDREKRKWNNDGLHRKMLAYQYNYLDSIAFFCNQHHVRFLLFQSPIRQELYLKLDASKKKKLNDHLSQVKAILDKYHSIFVDGNTQLWDDRYYIDGLHLNVTGSYHFTKFCINQLY